MAKAPLHIKEHDSGFLSCGLPKNNHKKTYVRSDCLTLMMLLVPYNLTIAVKDSPRGYPRMAAFLDSDDCFSVYRRFGFLHARLLLHKQDELRVLEEDLRDMDDRDAGKKATKDFLMSRAKDDLRRDLPENLKRKTLLAEIEKKTLEYGMTICQRVLTVTNLVIKGAILLQAQQLVAVNKPAARDFVSVVNYIDAEQPLCPPDREFIFEKEDLITLRPGREHAWLDALIEQALKISPTFLQASQLYSRSKLPELTARCIL